MAETPYLTTSRLTIRRFQPADADDLHAYLSDPQVYRFEPGEPLDRALASQRAAEWPRPPTFGRSSCAAQGK